MNFGRQFRRTRNAAGCLLLFGLMQVGEVDAQLTMTETVVPTLGIVVGGPAGRQFVLNTNDVVTGANAADYLFGAVSGQIVFRQRQGSAWIQVFAENIVTTGGLNANGIVCQWHNGPQTSCDGAGLTELINGRRILRLGVDVSTTQFHSGGDVASVSFDITATFL